MTAVSSGYVSVRLRVVPHFSSGIVERVKHERAWKSPHARRARRVLPFLAWGDFNARSRFAPSTIPEEKWGTTRSLCIGQPSDLHRSSEATEVWFSHLILHWHLAVPAQSSFTGDFCQRGTGIYFVPRFVVQPLFNRSFLSSKNSHFENECENEFYLHDNKNHFHDDGFARSLALKQRLGTTRKWPIHADALVLLVKVMLELFITFNFFLILMCVVCRSFVAWSKFFSSCSPGSSYQAQEFDGSRGSHGPKSHISCEHQPARTRDVRDSLRFPKWKEAVRI